MFKKIGIALLVFALMTCMLVSCGQSALTEADVEEIVADAIVGIELQAGPAGKDGVDGTNGVDGVTPHIGENGNWYVGDTDTGIAAQGPAGKDGIDGINGTNGKDGIDGKDFVIEDATLPYDKFGSYTSKVDVAGFGNSYEREALKLEFDAFATYEALKTGTVPDTVTAMIADLRKVSSTASFFVVTGEVYYYNTVTKVLTTGTYTAAIETATVNGITYGPYVNTTVSSFVETTQWIDNMGVTFVEHVH